VVIPGPADPVVALQGDGLLDVIWAGGAPTTRTEASAAPVGAHNLWEFVTGPEAVIAVLQRLAPRAAVIDEVGGLPESASAAVNGDPWCFVTRGGEVLQMGMHAARRSEAGAEALLSARRELQEVVDARGGIVTALEAARAAKQAAAGEVAEAESTLREEEGRLRESQRRAFSEGNEADLHVRRVEEAVAQLQELTVRDLKETELAARMESDSADLEKAIIARETELDDAREALRAVQARLESLRRRVGRLEEKRKPSRSSGGPAPGRWRAHSAGTGAGARSATECAEGTRALQAACGRFVLLPTSAYGAAGDRGFLGGTSPPRGRLDGSTSGRRALPIGTGSAGHARLGRNRSRIAARARRTGGYHRRGPGGAGTGG